jgi:hypothetical protein
MLLKKERNTPELLIKNYFSAGVLFARGDFWAPLSAGKTIDIVVFLIGSKSLSNALVKIHKKDVAVRLHK